MIIIKIQIQWNKKTKWTIRIIRTHVHVSPAGQARLQGMSCGRKNWSDNYKTKQGARKQAPPGSSGGTKGFCGSQPGGPDAKECFNRQLAMFSKLWQAGPCLWGFIKTKEMLSNCFSAIFLSEWWLHNCRHLMLDVKFSEVWIPKLGALPTIDSVSLTHILCLFAYLYEVVLCVWTFFSTCLSICVSRAACFVFSSISIPIFFQIQCAPMSQRLLIYT